LATVVQCSTNVFDAVRVFNRVTLGLSQARSISTTLHTVFTLSLTYFTSYTLKYTFVSTHRHAKYRPRSASAP